MRKGVSWKPQLSKSLKIAFAALIAITLAGELGLKYSATAGIITVLSIQNTKRETLKSALNRWLAFGCALIFAMLCFSLAGYNVFAFGGYLFLFALLCRIVGWTEAIAMDSVLVTHFLTEQNMEPRLLVNEALLLLIGTGMGVLVNLHLHKRQEEFRRLAGEVDMQLKEMLHRMSQMLMPSLSPEEDKERKTSLIENREIHEENEEIFQENKGAFLEKPEERFDKLQKTIEEAGACAMSNYGNTLLSKSFFELEYIAMRERQSVILHEIYENILKIRYLPEQAIQVAELMEQMARRFHEENMGERLLKQQEEVLMHMKEQPLPHSREEFEARALLFYILMQLKQFLQN